ncbi:hypothetical protein RFI_05863, partial [Reticulomyxa filosa]
GRKAISFSLAQNEILRLLEYNREACDLNHKMLKKLFGANMELVNVQHSSLSYKQKAKMGNDFASDYLLFTNINDNKNRLDLESIRKYLQTIIESSKKYDVGASHTSMFFGIQSDHNNSMNTFWKPLADRCGVSVVLQDTFLYAIGIKKNVQEFERRMLSILKDCINWECNNNEFFQKVAHVVTDPSSTIFQNNDLRCAYWDHHNNKALIFGDWAHSHAKKESVQEALRLLSQQ